jgi:hypothetical protein
METMTPPEIYDFIGDLAMCLYSKKIRINFTSLNSILSEKGCEFGNNKGLASGVAAAYRHWEKKDPVVHSAIAHTFTNKDGVLAWLAYE